MIRKLLFFSAFPLLYSCGTECYKARNTLTDTLDLRKLRPTDEYKNARQSTKEKITFNPDFDMYEVNGKIFYLLEDSTLPLTKFLLNFVESIINIQKGIPNIGKNEEELQTLKYAKKIKKELDNTIFNYFKVD